MSGLLLAVALCVQGINPDYHCTPGVAFPVTAAQVCVKGYSGGVRDVSEATKRSVMTAYGVDPKKHPKLEIDHLISLELGGSNDAHNLWPEMQDPRPGFREKDHAENYLHSQMCDGKITLQEAQRRIVNDWVGAYKEYQAAKK